MKLSQQLNISKTAFWDIDFDALDCQNSSPFIINKVFNYGTFTDQLAIIKFYGIERIKAEVVQGAYFRKPVFEFICGYFNLDKSLFKSYLLRQQQPNYWNV